MNRKATPDQNDISNIIGNLPQRLQKKIAEGAGQPSAKASPTTTAKNALVDDSNTSKSAQNGITVVKFDVVEKYCKRSRDSNGLPKAVLFQRGKEQTQPHVSILKPDDNNINALDSSVDVLNERAQTPVDPTDAGSKKEDVVVPGIIRLSTAEVTHLHKTEKSTAKHENGRRQQQHVAQRGLHSTRSQSKIVYPKWFDSTDMPYIKELKDLHNAMLKFIAENTVLENWQTFCEIRQQLQQVFTQLLLHHLKFCCEQKVDTFFWKLLYYKVREHLKARKTAEASAHILSLIEEGLAFYVSLHSQLSTKYLNNSHKFEFIAKVTVQKLLICLGDLRRYKTKQHQCHDLSEAANYYKQAQELIPSNGIPYNQLAIVAICERKKFDAVYYYMRSLMSSNAIHSARENLSVLFDEIRKKYEETELKTSPVHQHYGSIMSNSSSKAKSNSLRKEVWIYPDGVRRLHRTKNSSNNMNNMNTTFVSEENRLHELASDDLLRRFMALYLYVIGKFYTGIGMEAIQEQQRKLLVHLSALLKRDNLVITQTRLLQMVALNIFILEHNMQKISSREIRYHAFNFCNQMFGLILLKCNEIFAADDDDAISTTIKEGKQSENNKNAFTQRSIIELNMLLQYVKIYFDWLTRSVHIWEPIRNEENVFVYCWLELERLIDNLKSALEEANCNELLTTPQLPLDEDNFLIGFTPLNSNINGNRSSRIATKATKENGHTTSTPNERAQFCVRIKEILKFEKCYEAHEKSLKVAEQEDSSFILEDLNSEIQNAFANLQCAASTVGGVALNDVDTNNESDDNSENIVENGLQRTIAALETKDAQMTHLLKLKNELTAKKNVKKMYNAKLEEILKYVDTNLYVEVRPKYLLPDTNCFIDSLEDFERLIKEFKRYTLHIPLTVVKELDGLSKGVKLESYQNSLQKHRIHHYDDVSTRAKKSLDFIKTARNNVKCVTTKGSVINASLFALVEEENVSNDDKILATALALSKTMSTETSTDGKCFIQTELVLITTDRNLRVKALSRNLAVSELSEFLQWAKDCNS